jgi:ABC-type sugar transport system ATPase subunit
MISAVVAGRSGFFPPIPPGGSIPAAWFPAGRALAGGMPPRSLLEVRGVSKHFPGVQALRDVSLEVCSGEVHALLGANGAGKSTLTKIIAGVHSPDRGVLVHRGEEIQLQNPHQASELGIAVIYQEFSLFPELDVAENLLVGRMPTGRGRIDWPSVYERSRDILDDLGVSLDARRPVKSLSVAERQMVEVARAVSKSAELLIMDEPTAALSTVQIARLFEVIRRLQRRNCSIIYITHRLEEVMHIADRVSILRDGQHVGTWPIAALNLPGIVALMVGQPVTVADVRHSGDAPRPAATPRLEIRGLTRRGVLSGIDLLVRAGEIVGIGGLVGSGRTDLCRALFGVDRVDAGQVLVDGKLVRIRSPRDAIRAGIGYVPEDRKTQGLVLCLSVRENVVAAIRNRIRGGWLVDRREEQRVVRGLVSRLRIVATALGQVVRNLSGGNQQKVVLAKWLATNSRILIVDEPTRGIDVGAKGQVHAILRSLADQGVGILMVSSENQELLANADRIVVMREGRIVKELETSMATDEQLLYYAAGGREQQ